MKAWPIVKLRDVLYLDLHKDFVDAAKRYEMVGVLSFGKGLFPREAIESGNTSYKYFLQLKPEHIVMSQLFGWEGALALSSDEFSGRYVSPMFPTFVCDESRISRQFIGWVMRQPTFWNDLGSRAKGMGDRRRTLNPDSLFESTTPLPSLDEQQAIVARLDALAEKTRQLEAHLDAVERDAEHLLALRFRDAIANAPLRTMAEIAPLVRREQHIDLNGSYPELGIRSFGKGTFHKPPLSGGDVGTKRLFSIEPGDLLFSNVFAWEGAIAIAQAEDAGRFGSHRFISCVPDRRLTSADFLRYYFLTDEGMLKIGEASPGGAGRNRTLGLEKLMAIEVPMPALTTQQTFDRLQAEIAALKAKHAAIRKANAALLPATLERMFAA
ncbi:MAG: hypothetical protein PHD68_03035 [Rugosibacter sp.]|nr:hypothetical protein [Rugosibacter sp.]